MYLSALRKENQEKVLSVVISPTNSIVFFERTEELDNMKETQGGQERAAPTWLWPLDDKAASGLHSLSLSSHTQGTNTEDLRSSSEEHHCSISHSEL
jgi:hypothetical protein